MASGDRNLEFARQVVELGVSRQQPRGFEHQRRGIADFVGIDARNRAAGDVADDIAARSGRIQAHLPEAIEHLRQRFDGDPMQLNILTDGEVGDSVGVKAGEVGDGSKLAGGHDAIGNSDSHHEALERAAFAALPAGYTGAVALRVNAPPAEIGANPFGRDGTETLARETANFVQALPGVLGALETLDALRFRFFSCGRHRKFAIKQKPTASWSGGGL